MKGEGVIMVIQDQNAWALRLDVDPDWKDLKERLDPVLTTIKSGVTHIVAKTMAAVAEGGMECAGVRGTKVLLGLNLEEFCRDVVVRMVEQNAQVAVAKMELCAMMSGGAILVQQLSLALLCSGHVWHAAAVTVAFVDECRRVRMTSHTIAGCISPAVVAAVDDGRGKEVACVQKLMVDEGYSDIVTWMTIHIAGDMGRPDAVAKGTVAAIVGVEGGHDMAASLAAKAMMMGFHDEVAASAVCMDELVTSFKDTKVVKVVASAAILGVEAGRTIDVVWVSHHMARRGARRVVTRAMNDMAERGVYESRLAALVSSTAILHGFVPLTTMLIMDVLACGYIYAFCTIGFFTMLQLVFIVPLMTLQTVFLRIVVRREHVNPRETVTSHPIQDLHSFGQPHPGVSDSTRKF